jgi:hypothetical protein
VTIGSVDKLEIDESPGPYADTFADAKEAKLPNDVQRPSRHILNHAHFGPAVFVAEKGGGFYIHGWPPCNLKKCVVVMLQSCKQRSGQAPPAKKGRRSDKQSPLNILCEACAPQRLGQTFVYAATKIIVAYVLWCSVGSYLLVNQTRSRKQQTRGYSGSSTPSPGLWPPSPSGRRAGGEGVYENFQGPPQPYEYSWVSGIAGK